MSTFAYGVMTKAREKTGPVTRGKTSLPGVKGYIDAVAALVPAEILAFHALALQFTTKTIQSDGPGQVTGRVEEKVSTAKGENVTVVTEPGTLKIVFAGLVLAAPVIYWVGHRKSWHPADFVRMLIPAAAFAVWTALQKATAFDAIWPSLSEAERFLGAAAIALALGFLARELAYKADGSTP